MPKVTEGSGREYPPVTDLEGLDNDLSAQDRTWLSDEYRKRVAIKLKLLLKGNTDCFSRIDIRPLYKKGTRNYYRVVIFIRDYLQEGFMPTSKIFLSYFIEVEGKDCWIRSTNPQIDKF
jgi:hypothetical protein